MKTRKIYFVGVPDNMNNSWYIGASAETKKEAEEKLMSRLSEPSNYWITGKVKYMTYIEQYCENKGWDTIKAIDGWE